MDSVSDVLNIFCYDWSLAESYGRVARELKAGLEARGVYVNAFGTNAPQQPIRIAFGGIALGYPTSIQALGKLFTSGPMIWITAFESDELPFLWADILNTADAVIVPSRFLIDVFRSSGVSSPVLAIPQGVSKVFQPVIRQRNPGEPMRFLAIADRGRRKGWHLAGFAFKRAFGDSMDYHLTLKAREGFPIEFTNPNISVISADYSDCGMAELYQQTDVFIAPGAEGYGLPPREFAATGGLSLALDWGGTADDLPSWGLPIKANRIPAWEGHKFQGVGQWGEADVEDLAQTLRMVAAHRAYWSRWALRNTQWVARAYDWQTYADQVYTVWRTAINGISRVRAAV